MPTAKKSAKNNKLKIGKSITVNKWLALGFVAAVVASAIVIVRYSGASGTVWSINSKAVLHNGGTIKYKDNGSAYWIGTNKGEYVKFTSTRTGTYCMEGKYLTKNMMVSQIISDSQGGRGGVVNIGSQVDYSNCVALKLGESFSMGIESAGTMTFNRVRQQ